MSNIEEIDQKPQPVEPGWVGNLNDEQHKALVQMWESYFDICDRARGNKTKGSGFQADNTGKDPKKSGIPDDDAAKDEVKKQQEQQGMNDLLETYGSEALRDSWWNFVRGDNPDGMMLKFIRARKGDVGRGMAMMATMLRWRLDNDVETLILNGDLINGKEIPKFIEQQKSGKVYSLGSTGSDEPICYVIMKYHSIWGQPAVSMQKFIITQMETFRLLMADPVDKACIFFDLKGFGIKQMDIVSLLYLVKALESYYPESLAKMYVSNAPYIFWGFWKVVKNLLDPVVRNKIVFITGPAETGEHVPAERMIKYCGGEVESTFNFVEPKQGENDVQQDKETKDKLLARHRKLTDQYEKITRKWCESGGKDEQLSEQRMVLAKKMRLSQFILDPYTRGKTAYHRNGTIPEESPGIAVFDYQIGDKTTRQILGRFACQKSMERELYEIVNGSTSEEAAEKTKKMVADGTWGEWKVNDNSDEIKKTAEASLNDIEGKTDAKDLPKAAESDSTPAAAESTHDEQKESNGTAAAAAAAPAAAATSNGDTTSNGDAKAPTSNGQTTRSPSNANNPGPRLSNNVSSPKKSAGTTDYAAEDSNGAPKKGLLGSLKAKIKN
jgi:hypothetical protein